ncbi:MAG: GNAT family N-acetyltransferase [Chloroflexi bacterium]|nr:GNAT family N-acetyltransferase [Chloroflexota bacterium]
MAELTLELPAETHREAYLAMMDEWLAFGGRLNPGMLRNNGASYEDWLSRVRAARDARTCPAGRVPQTLYLAFNDQGELVGAVSLRPQPDEATMRDAGHVAYGVRPSQRRKGYATQMLALAVERLRALGVARVWVTCAADNEASIGTVLRNGGVLEDEITSSGGEVRKRFCIAPR